MTAITCTRRVQFAAGHRVMGHESKCANLHGHNYVALLEAQAQYNEGGLDSLGRVVDFSVLKERVGGWIEEVWDHGFIVFERDEQALEAMACVEGQKLFRAPFNPTAENMAKYLLNVVGLITLPGTGVRLVRVQLWETENCIAEARLTAPLAGFL